MSSLGSEKDPVLEAGSDSLHGLAQAFAMIIVSEIGDKTFLIAAILAMRHPRLVVFAGAFGSLFVMSGLSAAMGHLLPTLVSRKWTQMAAAVLFLVFGARMALEGKRMEGGNAKMAEEMKEAEEEIEGDDAERDGTGVHDGEEGEVIPLEGMEEGGRRFSHKRQPSKTSFSDGARNFCSLFFGPVFVQAFVLTFLGEWGDRSQIATIALAAAHVSILFPCSFISSPTSILRHRTFML
jgi:Ca2+/H+ antiporter, TMEM165/GDT1 family